MTEAAYEDDNNNMATIIITAGAANNKVIYRIIYVVRLRKSDYDDIIPTYV